jgi:hypothetical protein
VSFSDYYDSVQEEVFLKQLNDYNHFRVRLQSCGFSKERNANALHVLFFKRYKCRFHSLQAAAGRNSLFTALFYLQKFIVLHVTIVTCYDTVRQETTNTSVIKDVKRYCLQNSM